MLFRFFRALTVCIYFVWYSSDICCYTELKFVGVCLCLCSLIVFGFCVFWHACLNYLMLCALTKYFCCWLFLFILFACCSYFVFCEFCWFVFMLFDYLALILQLPFLLLLFFGGEAGGDHFRTRNGPHWALARWFWPGEGSNTSRILFPAGILELSEGCAFYASAHAISWDTCIHMCIYIYIYPPTTRRRVGHKKCSLPLYLLPLPLPLPRGTVSDYCGGGRAMDA